MIKKEVSYQINVEPVKNTRIPCVVLNNLIKMFQNVKVMFKFIEIFSSLLNRTLDFLSALGVEKHQRRLV